MRAFVSWAPMNGHVSARCPACPHLLHDAVPVTKMLFPSRVSCPRLAIGLSHVVDFCPADESLALAAIEALLDELRGMNQETGAFIELGLGKNPLCS